MPRQGFQYPDFYIIAASLAFRLPTTLKQMSGLTAYAIYANISIKCRPFRITRGQLTVRNLAIAILSSSLFPLTSARADNFRAGGPVGISIIVNQSIGSLLSQWVRTATK